MKIYEDDTRMLVVTGIPGAHALSVNRKTGPMAQAWVLPVDHPPTAPAGQAASCGSCPLSPVNKGGCYVITGQAPLSVFKTYVDAPVTPLRKVPKMPLGLRITAWGEPSFIPLEVWGQLLAKATFHTGYTHQWRDLDPQRWGFLMASVETEAEAEAAWTMGWRTFRILPENHQALATNEEVMCPTVRGDSSCYQCRACCGTRSATRSIVIPVHGSQRKRAVDIIEAKEDKET